MEKFMLIFHGGQMDGLSAQEMEAHMGKWLAWVEKLTKAGKYVSGEPLLPGGKLIQAKGSVTDGPYTEGKEVVGGFFIINAANMQEAVDICDDFPDFEMGSTIQVRQVMKIEM